MYIPRPIHTILFPELLVGQATTHYPNVLLKEIENCNYDQMT